MNILQQMQSVYSELQQVGKGIEVILKMENGQWSFSCGGFPATDDMPKYYRETSVNLEEAAYLLKLKLSPAKVTPTITPEMVSELV